MDPETQAFLRLLDLGVPVALAKDLYPGIVDRPGVAEAIKQVAAWRTARTLIRLYARFEAGDSAWGKALESWQEGTRRFDEVPGQRPASLKDLIVDDEKILDAIRKYLPGVGEEDLPASVQALRLMLAELQGQLAARPPPHDSSPYSTPPANDTTPTNEPPPDLTVSVSPTLTGLADEPDPSEA